MSPEDIQRVIERYVTRRRRVEQGGRKVRVTNWWTDRSACGADKGLPTVTDGPYAEAREVIRGLFIVERRTTTKSSDNAMMDVPALVKDLFRRQASTSVAHDVPCPPAALAELWREAGDRRQAAACYRAALQLARAAPERRFLAMQLDGL